MNCEMNKAPRQMFIAVIAENRFSFALFIFTGPSAHSPTSALVNLPYGRKPSQFSTWSKHQRLLPNPQLSKLRLGLQYFLALRCLDQCLSDINDLSPLPAVEKKSDSSR